MLYHISVTNYTVLIQDLQGIVVEHLPCPTGKFLRLHVHMYEREAYMLPCHLYYMMSLLVE